MISWDNLRRNSLVLPGMLLGLTCVAAFIVPATSRAQGSRAYLTRESERNGSAVDARGVRRYGKNYPGKFPPWIDDRTQGVAPKYWYEDRWHKREGVGWFRISLDLRTGLVRKVVILSSTGFRGLDNSALTALHQWRWKPGKWQEIDMPVAFTLESPSFRPPPGAVRLPNATER